MTQVPEYKKKDFISDQEVRWCPGCGDYAILSAVQMSMTKIGRKKEDIVFVSGIGCSSRFPYYMDTFGMHTIHGRAPAIASGVKLQNPDLSVWVVTGDGDGMSIGGNHLIHCIRRNVDLKILLFNNEIYGLTKGQYSPTSQPGLVTKSTPYGSLDRAFLTGALVLGAGATFIARTIDTDPKHKGTAFVEIYQNCVIFNDKVHDVYTNRASRDDHTIRLEHGKPMIFGKEGKKGIVLDGFNPKVVTIGENGVTEKDLLVHDKSSLNMASMLSNIHGAGMPIPLGVIRSVEAPVYDTQVTEQINAIKAKKGKGSVAKLLASGETWEVK
jgi:2-oxoglutarate ferredoxin oxidoreductase subunit beta